MKSEPIQIVLVAESQVEFARLRDLFSSAPHVEVVAGRVIEVAKTLSLDAIWLTPMLSTYFGVDSRAFRPLQALIAEMPSEKQSEGLPRWIIAGTLPRPGEVLDAVETASLHATTLLMAVQAHNFASADKVARVGAIPASMGLSLEDHLDEAAAIMRDVFQQLPPHMQSGFVSAATGKEPAVSKCRTAA